MGFRVLGHASVLAKRHTHFTDQRYAPFFSERFGKRDLGPSWGAVPRIFLQIPNHGWGGDATFWNAGRRSGAL